jgi:hypothetical protein
MLFLFVGQSLAVCDTTHDFGTHFLSRKVAEASKHAKGVPSFYKTEERLRNRNIHLTPMKENCAESPEVMSFSPMGEKSSPIKLPGATENLANPRLPPESSPQSNATAVQLSESNRTCFRVASAER